MLKVITLLCVSLISGCVLRKPGVSSPKHELGAFTRDQSKFNWYELTRSEYESSMAETDRLISRATGQVQQTKIFPDSHKAVVRLQYWANKIDDMVRAKDPIKFISIPRPKMAIVQADDVNAYGSNISICTDLIIYINGKMTSTGEAVFNRNLGKFEFDYPEMYCVKTKLSIQEQIEQLTWNLSPYKGCVAESSGTSVNVQSPATCHTEYDSGRNRLVLKAASNYITVHSKLVSSLPEQMVVAILAHELAHYYRSHITAPDAWYGQFYKLGEKNQDSVPQPDPAAEAIGGELLRRSKAWDRPITLTSVSGAKYNSALFKFVSRMTNLSNYVQNDNGSCARLTTFLKDKKDVFSDFPQSPLPTDVVPSYFQYEKLVDDCSVGELDRFGILNVRASIGYEKDYISRLIFSTLGDFPNFASIKELFAVVHESFPKAEERALALYDEAFRKFLESDIGQYTIEQEADEIELEISLNLGIPVSAVIGSKLELLKIYDDQQPAVPRSDWPKNSPPKSIDHVLPSIGYERCQDLFNNNWKTPDSHYFYVPIGSLIDKHHSGCYRAFNLSREVKAHNFADPQVSFSPPTESS